MFPPVKGVDDSVIEAAVNNLLRCSEPRDQLFAAGNRHRCRLYALRQPRPNCFVIESFMDELAAAAGKNPYDFSKCSTSARSRGSDACCNSPRTRRMGQGVRGALSRHGADGGLTTHLAQVAEISIAGGELKVHKIVCVVDCGQMVNPTHRRIADRKRHRLGLSAALWGEVTIAAEESNKTNFNNYRLLRNNELPES